MAQLRNMAQQSGQCVTLLACAGGVCKQVAQVCPEGQSSDKGG